MDFRRKNVCVVGTGISGIGAANLLSKAGANVMLYDGNEDVDKKQIEDKLDDLSNITIVIGDLSDELINSLDMAVLSPGVPIDLPVVDEIKNAGAKIWGEVELAYNCGKGRVVAITGTNGKTTTTALTGEIMKNYFESVFVVGNIGTPYTSVVDHMTQDTVTVAEISSFQLETIENFQPVASAILNITPDHLNRHKTMENYIEVKESITKNQTTDNTCILNYEDEILRKFGSTLNTNVLYFSSQNILKKGIYLENENIVYNDGKKYRDYLQDNRIKTARKTQS